MTLRELSRSVPDSSDTFYITKIGTLIVISYYKDIYIKSK